MILKINRIITESVILQRYSGSKLSNNFVKKLNWWIGMLQRKGKFKRRVLTSFSEF